MNGGCPCPSRFSRGGRRCGLEITVHCLALLSFPAVGAQEFVPVPLGTAAPLAPIFSEVPLVTLEPKVIANFSVLEGRETSITAQPFYILSPKFDREIVTNALNAIAELEFDEHNDEADWLPAFEVYIRERSAPVPGAAPEALHVAVDHIDRDIMPFVREAYGCPSCVLCTSFVRRYLPNERVRVPAHFDVTSFSTIVMPLTPLANYSGGFYVQPTAHIDSRLFVPVEEGDVAVYDFTLNHGVEVLSGGRMILANWVSANEQACRRSATPWHAERAQNGDLVAQHILSMMYGQGNGAPKDDSKALQWALMAAEGGLANAQFSAGTMYFEGAGTELNESKAYYWYEKAAGQGDASAQLILSRMLSEGVGVSQDYPAAEYWFRLGSSQKGATLMGPPRWSR